MTSIFKNIGILGRAKSTGFKETLIALTEHLESISQNYFIETKTAELLKNTNLKTTDRDNIGEKCDLIIVIGGDGSFLHAVHAIINQKIPVVGINRGSLGFLTDINPDSLIKITDILSGKYILEKRFLLSASIEYENKVTEKDKALNEVA
ncbi:NAD(+)/NADH kinase, partial [Gammaproteobacteria bacterium]|nr:NAD(+)/NADH kinase [Gammaproteobacteria bacterium]